MKAVNRIEFAQGLARLHLPRYDEIPHIDLYMDQLISYLEESLAPLYQPGEKIITSSMVNNYVKQGILSATTSKRYTRHHVAYLIVICVLKQTFSISEIDRLIRRQIDSFATDVAYDYFCTALEAACQALFAAEPSVPKSLTNGGSEGDSERDLVIASSAAVAYTLYIKASLLAGSV